MFALCALVALLLALLAARHAVFLFVEDQAFITPPAGALVPDALGVPSQQLAFGSGERMLLASFVAAPDPAAPALLIFHGDEEDISRWAAAQVRLHAAGIASFVFDYSGYGASTGKPSVAHLQHDALAAYQQFLAATPRAERRYALGFSLGSAVLIDVADRLQPPLHGIVSAAGFASAREMAVANQLIPAWAAWLLPDLWNSEKRLAGLTTALLIVHSRADEVIPFEQALRLCKAAQGRRRLVLLEGLLHDAPLQAVGAEPFWKLVVEAVRSGDVAAAAANAQPC